MKRILLFSTALILSFLSFADTTHTVQKGDTLYSISRKYGTTVQKISDVNKIDGTGIKTGQVLLIPGENNNAQTKTPSSDDKQKPAALSAATEYYTVQKGDTWYGISRAKGIAVADLQKLNDTDGSSGLKVGQKIKIPKQTQVQTKAPDKRPAQKTSSVEMAVTDTHSYSGKKGDSSLDWPVKNPQVSYLKGKVSGVTLSAQKDEGVNSIREGTVMFAGTYRGFGNVVFVQSKTGHIYAYTGLGKVSVSKGEYVTYGEKLGTVGIDSYSHKSQITFMVFQNGNPIDPAKAPRG